MQQFEMPLNFIKKKYASTAGAIAASTQTQGAVVFDKQHHIICVDGDIYGGDVQNVEFDQQNSTLSIWKAGDVDPSIVLNFSDVASASGMMKVFQQLRETIGTAENMSVQQALANTNYLQGVQTIVQGLQGLDAKAKETVQGLIEVEQVVEETFESVQEAVGLQSNMSWVAPEGSNFVQGTESVKEAIGALDQSLQGAIEGNDEKIEAIQEAVGLQGDLSWSAPEGANFVQGTQTVKEAIQVLDQSVQHVVQEVIDNEEVTRDTFQAVQQAVGLNDDFEWETPASSHYVQGTTSAMQAVVQLDQAIQGIVADSKTYEMVQEVTPNEGYLKTYTLMEKVGNTSVQSGVQINIPKDFLVKSASIQTVVTQGVPYPEAQVGDKYIDFVVNVKDGVQPADEHIYLPFKDLVALYTPEQDATQVQIAISADNVISATLVDGGVSTAKLADEAVQTSKIGNQAVTNAKLADEVVQVNQNVPEIKANDPDNAGASQGVTLAQVGGKDIKAKVGLYWAEWSDDNDAVVPDAEP